MPRRVARLLSIMALALLSPVLLHASDAVPTLTRHVTDLTGTLTAEQVDRLDAQLVSLEKAKGTQLVVLMVGSTAPRDIESYSLAVAEANKIGRKGTDDGVLLLVAKNDRRVRIEVGYGLEGAIPDAATARIIREYIAPKFRTNDYVGGINDAVGALTQLIDGEPLPPPVQGNAEQPRRGVGLLMIGLFLALFLRSVLGRASGWIRAPIGALVTGGLLWLLVSLGAGIIGALMGGILMLLPFGGGGFIGGGGWGGFGGGGGFGSGGGSLGGGGFSGGGGSFGGGGSSGNW